VVAIDLPGLVSRKRDRICFRRKRWGISSPVDDGVGLGSRSLRRSRCWHVRRLVGCRACSRVSAQPGNRWRAIAVPLEVGGALKDILEAPDMEGFRQIDSKDILGPVYDAIPGNTPPAAVKDDYLESYAGDRFVESTVTSARIRRNYPN